MYDAPHLIKSIRNRFLAGEFRTPDGIANFDAIREIFDIERGNVTKMTKLTESHVRPNKFQQMRVVYAVQALSRSVAAAIESATENRQMSRNGVKKALSTASFVRKIDAYFDCLNGKALFDRNPLRRGLKPDNDVWNKLLELQKYFQNVEYLGGRIYCLEGLRQTTAGILLLTGDILQDYPDKDCILTSRFNQDPVENLFSSVRSKGGNSRNPSVHEFNIIIAKLISVKLIQFSPLSNSLSDNDYILPVTFDSIIYDCNTRFEESTNNTVSQITHSDILEQNKDFLMTT